MLILWSIKNVKKNYCCHILINWNCDDVVKNQNVLSLFFCIAFWLANFNRQSNLEDFIKKAQGTIKKAVDIFPVVSLQAYTISGITGWLTDCYVEYHQSSLVICVFNLAWIDWERLVKNLSPVSSSTSRTVATCVCTYSFIDLIWNLNLYGAKCQFMNFLYTALLDI